MSRRVRDVVFTAIALAVLFAALVSVNPQLRDRAQQMTWSSELDAVEGAVARAVSTGVSVVRIYAGDHTYLFTFTVAACVFAVMMLRVIS